MNFGHAPISVYHWKASFWHLEFVFENAFVARRTGRAARCVARCRIHCRHSSFEPWCTDSLAGAALCRPLRSLSSDFVVAQLLLEV